MGDEPLRRILQEADAAAGPPPDLPAGLARRVRRLAVRRRRVRFGFSAAAAIALSVGMTALWFQAPTPSGLSGGSRIVQRPEPADVESIRAEIEGLRREADVRLAVAQRTQEILEQMRRAEALTKHAVPLPDPVADARRELDKAAYTLVSQADRMCRELDLCDSAAIKYQRVVELFPETPWATVARQRLEQIKKGELS
jgi:hypothetical protein